MLRAIGDLPFTRLARASLGDAKKRIGAFPCRSSFRTLKEPRTRKHPRPLLSYGVSEGIRTPDPQIHSLML